MANDEDNIIIEAPLEQGYSLHDLVTFASDDELAKIDSQTLAETNPRTIALFLERIDVDRQREVLRRFDPEKVSEIVSEMDPELSAELVSEMREFRAVSVLNEMEPDDAADIVRELEDEDKDRLLKGMERANPESSEDIRELLEYPADTAGAIMNPHVATLRTDMTIDDAISAVRQMRDEYEAIYYLYVIGDDDVLEGVLSLRSLLLAPKGANVKDIMSKTLIGLLAPTMDREVVAHIMADTNYHTLPVVGDNGELLGIITHDDVIDIMIEEGTEDMQKLAGAGADEGLFDPIATSMRQRIPWLLVNLITAFLAAAVVGIFSKKIDVLPILAVFMPIIAAIGGNTGAQTLAITVRSLALGEVEVFDRGRICLRETLKGFYNGIFIGLLGAGIAFISTGKFDLSLIVWTSMLMNMSLGGFMGSFIPFTLKKYGFDPASGSSVFATSVTDSGGFFIFLGLGSFFLS
ncbi:MAG: magnesium transporter [Verrucomicrobiaceae bacterium]|nr:magnesium transporter [Verrucomicrobiaceae bacterium]